MPTPINIITTCAPNDRLTVHELNFTYNKIFNAGTDIHFAINLDYLNELRTDIGLLAISSTTIQNNLKSLVVFLCNSIDGSNNFIGIQSTVTYSLTSSNLSGTFLNRDISNNSTDTFGMSSYDFGKSLTQEEILGISKNYKLIFRITNTSNPDTSATLQDGDIVQDFTLMLDPDEQGPYEVEYRTIDILNPNYFSTEDFYEINSSSGALIGSNFQRVFYPKNINSLNPLPVAMIFHGQNHNNLMYDIYASLFASHGYFVIIMASVLTLSNNGFRPLALTRHFSLYSSKIDGGFFNGKIDLTNITWIGHSVGGGGGVTDAMNALYNNTPIVPVPGVTFGCIKNQILLESAGGWGNPLNTGFHIISSLSNTNYTGTPALQFTFKNPSVFSPATLLLDGNHEDIATNFSQVNEASIFPDINFINAFFNANFISYNKNIGQRKYNTRSTAIYELAKKSLLYCAVKKNLNLIDCYYNTNISYKNDIYQTNSKLSRTFYKPLTSEITFINTIQDTSGFTYVGLTQGKILSNNIPNPIELNGGTGPNSTLSGITSNVFYYGLDSLYGNYGPNPYDPAGSTYSNKSFTFKLQGTSSYIDFNVSGFTFIWENYDHISVNIGIINYCPFNNLDTYPIYPNQNSIFTNYFGLELVDNSNNSAIISSHQNNHGILIRPFAGGMTPNGNQAVSQDQAIFFAAIYSSSALTEHFNFRIKDFKNINPSLDLSSLKNIKILFNSNVGTTYAGFTGQYVINGLSLLN
jgi:hypothetical protein